MSQLPLVHDPELLKDFSIEWLEKLCFLPLSQTHSTLFVAMEETGEPHVTSFIQKLFPKKEIIPHFFPALLIREEIKRYTFTQHAFTLCKKVKVELATPLSKHDSPAIRELLELIFIRAIELESSDIHIEPTPHSAHIRLRVDGVLHTLIHLEFPLYAPLISSIKLMANLDIAIKRKPQDGRYSFPYKNCSYDLRISLIPTLLGESLVMRILDQTKRGLSLEEIGIDPSHLFTLQKALQTPYGMILVTGPTGSGKSTTLYAMLKALNSPHLKIITVEDPIEYQLPLIQQLPIDPKGGLGFPQALKHILRQDPDIIMVGEIRDHETLKIAVQASLTGHQLLSTLHTNDAISAIDRMIDMGVESYLISGTLRAVIAQRLIRKLCPSCKQLSSSPPPLSLPLHTSFYEPVGCPLCAMTGYKGREAISEILFITPGISHLIATHQPKEEILTLAKKQGYTPMLSDGLKKVSQGITSLAEILKVTQGEVG